MEGGVTGARALGRNHERNSSGLIGLNSLGICNENPRAAKDPGEKHPATVKKGMANRVEPLKREPESFIDCVNRNKPFPVTLEQVTGNPEFGEQISMATINRE